jgi:hypothetical protein
MLIRHLHANFNTGNLIVLAKDKTKPFQKHGKANTMWRSVWPSIAKRTRQKTARQSTFAVCLPA